MHYAVLVDLGVDKKVCAVEPDTEMSYNRICLYEISGVLAIALEGKCVRKSWVRRLDRDLITFAIEIKIGGLGLSQKPVCVPIEIDHALVIYRDVNAFLRRL